MSTKLCFLVSIRAGDGRAALRDTALSAIGYHVGRFLPGTDPKDPPDYYVAGVGPNLDARDPLLDGNSNESHVGVIIGYNPDVDPLVLAELGRLQCAAVQMIAFDTVMTRQQMFTRLISEAGQAGYSHYWTIKPSDDLTAGVTVPTDLLAKFTQIQTLR